ncbi:hypothetical protein AB0D67_38295 [Streptosporangium sp. NPDC048047]|uniref:hypothetical protein n=1 Tax=Streptosporangium sp. NPDC048047 TaxID=3155748 RepID=UPI003412CC8E
MTPLTPIALLAARVTAYEELAQRGATEHEQRRATELADALRRRLLSERAGEPFDWAVLSIPGTGGQGKARFEAMLAITRAYGCTRAAYPPGMSPRDPSGGYELQFGGPTSLVQQVAEVLPGFLEEIEDAAKSATRAYGRYLKTLPDDDHDPRWRIGMSRRFRREYMTTYGRHLGYRILTGDRDRPTPLDADPWAAHAQATLAASRSDLRGCLPTAHGYIPVTRQGRRQIHAPDYTPPTLKEST